MTIATINNGASGAAVRAALNANFSELDARTAAAQAAADAADAAALGKYTLPASGIPKVALSSAVQVSLGRADAVGMLPRLMAATAPYRLMSYGDSRANGHNTGSTIGITGSGANVRPERTVGWIAHYLADCEYVADFGIGGDTASGWNLTGRVNSKTIANALANSADLVHIQYGINDIAAWNGSSPTQSALTANILGYLKALTTAMVCGGKRVIFESINPFDPLASASAFATNTAAKEQIRDDVNAGMSAWCAGLSGQVVYVDTDVDLVDSGTGYAKVVYLQADTLGVHLNRLGAQVAGLRIATAVRAMLPQRFGPLTIGPSYQPNLIPDNPSLFVSTEAGTVTVVAPTWNTLTADYTLPSGAIIPAGTRYAQTTLTPTALASGTARSRLEVHASGVSGATPTYPISIGDQIVGSAILVMDNGSDGGAVNLQSIEFRTRIYSASQFSDFGGLSVTDLTTLPVQIAGRVATPALPISIASASISAPAAGAGMSVQAYVENPTVGQAVRVRVFEPQIRVISRPQPSAITPGASPYTYTLTEHVSNQSAMVYVAGGTVSGISIARGAGTAIATGATAGQFLLARGDSITVTYSSAPTMTLVPI